jgi:hypothetical protein
MSATENSETIDAMKVIHPCEPVHENEAVFSSSAPFMRCEHESINSKLKNVVGRASEKLHSTLCNATEKVKSILAEGEMESNNTQDEEDTDLKRQSIKNDHPVDPSTGADLTEY